jgi:hypothetical protein
VGDASAAGAGEEVGGGADDLDPAAVGLSQRRFVGIDLAQGSSALLLVRVGRGCDERVLLVELVAQHDDD